MLLYGKIRCCNMWSLVIVFWKSLIFLSILLIQSVQMTVQALHGVCVYMCQYIETIIASTNMHYCNIKILLHKFNNCFVWGKLTQINIAQQFSISSISWVNSKLLQYEALGFVHQTIYVFHLHVLFIWKLLLIRIFFMQGMLQMFLLLKHQVKEELQQY